MTKTVPFIAATVAMLVAGMLADAAFAQAFPGMMVHPQAAMTHNGPPPEDSSMAVPAPMQPQAPAPQPAMAAQPAPTPAPTPTYTTPTQAYAAPAPAPRPYVFPPAYNSNAGPIQAPAPAPVVISAPTPAPTPMPMTAPKPVAASNTAEARIKNLHDRLAIMPEQEHDWAPVAQAMRDYDVVMSKLVQKRRALGPTPTAAQNLVSYQEMVAARGEALKHISDAFYYLYTNDMLPEQQGNADEVFASPGVMGQ